MLFIEGSWWSIATNYEVVTLFNVKAETKEQAIQIVQRYTGGTDIVDVWQPSSLQGKIISPI